VQTFSDVRDSCTSTGEAFSPAEDGSGTDYPDKYANSFAFAQQIRDDSDCHSEFIHVDCNLKDEIFKDNSLYDQSFEDPSNAVFRYETAAFYEDKIGIAQQVPGFVYVHFMAALLDAVHACSGSCACCTHCQGCSRVTSRHCVWFIDQCLSCLSNTHCVLRHSLCTAPNGLMVRRPHVVSCSYNNWSRLASPLEAFS
jgi:hypothetical protein